MKSINFFYKKNKLQSSSVNASKEEINAIETILTPILNEFNESGYDLSTFKFSLSNNELDEKIKRLKNHSNKYLVLYYKKNDIHWSFPLRKDRDIFSTKECFKLKDFTEKYNYSIKSIYIRIRLSKLIYLFNEYNFEIRELSNIESIEKEKKYIKALKNETNNIYVYKHCVTNFLLYKKENINIFKLFIDKYKIYIEEEKYNILDIYSFFLKEKGLNNFNSEVLDTIMKYSNINLKELRDPVFINYLKLKNF